MAKATNCTEKCNNYECCKENGSLDLWMPNTECTDYNDDMD